MTRYLDVRAVSQLIQAMGVEQVLVELAGYVAADYGRWAEFDLSPRNACHAPLGVLELMPIADKKLYGFKYVNGHPQNTEKGLLTVMAFGMLAEVATGYPLLLCEMTLLTAMRTAATSAVAALALARKDSRSMAVIGCGSQAEFQILAFKKLLGIHEFRVFDIDATTVQKLVRNLSAVEGLTLIPMPSAREAVKGADIITTLTADKTRATIITPDMVEAGVHINGVGGDCPGKTELHPDVLRSARVIVEYEKQTRVEGDIQQMPVDFPVVELWKVLTGAEQGRQNDSQITVFDSVGFALEDFSALRYINDVATARNIGSTLNLIPSLSDPKDLFSVLQHVSMPVPAALMVNAVGIERKQ